jgi:PAS domain S-box-containing protein
MSTEGPFARITGVALGLARDAVRGGLGLVDDLLSPDRTRLSSPQRPAQRHGQPAAEPEPERPDPEEPAEPEAGNGAPPEAAAEQLSDSTIFNSAHDAFVAMYSDGKITAWNPAAESTFGWTKDEAIGRTVAETIIPEELHDAHRKGMERFLDTGEANVLGKRIEMEAVHRDGHRFPIEMTISPVDLGDGDWSFYAFLHDISDRQQAERYRAAQLAVGGVLAGSASIEEAMPAALKAIGEASGFEAGAFWRQDADSGRLRCEVFWGDGRLDLDALEEETRSLELEPGEDLPGVALADRTATWVRKVAYDPDFSRAELAREAGIESALASPLTRDDHVYGVMELLTSAGQPPSPEALDALAVITSQLAEFSARKQTEQDSERLKDEFFALVSHELRTPLTSIIGYTDMLARKEAEQLSDRGIKMLEVIRRNAGREMRLVGDLLMLVRIEAGRFELEPGEVDLRPVVTEAVDAARPAAEKAGHELRLRAEHVRRFGGDGERIGQVVDNLLSNAIKFTPDGGEIEVRVSEGDEAAVIEVQDSGPGIPPEDLDRLFDRLYRASSATAGHVPGAGLGLTIVKGIVEAHGGRVEAESEVGSGTAFRVELPMGPAATPSAPAGANGNGNGAVPSRTGSQDADEVAS